MPADLQVNWVLRCTISNKGGSRLLIAERSVGDTGPLLRALKTPSALRIKVVCPMLRVLIPYFALVQAERHGLRAEGAGEQLRHAAEPGHRGAELAAVHRAVQQADQLTAHSQPLRLKPAQSSASSTTMITRLVMNPAWWPKPG